MTSPNVGSEVEADEISMISARALGSRCVVARARVRLAGSEGPEFVGVIPLDEISPYEDLDPTRSDRSWNVRLATCETLLRHCDRRFLVIDRDAGTSVLVLSLRRKHAQDHEVSRLDHRPPYEVTGFVHLRNLNFHLLKHPLGLGGAEEVWPRLLRDKFWRDGILGALKLKECPGARDFDGEKKRIELTNPCKACDVRQMLRCYGPLRSLRATYERRAAECVRSASDHLRPRHYHVLGWDADVPDALVFMDDDCGKVAAKRREESRYVPATFYQPEDCVPSGSNDAARFAAERIRIARAVRSSGLERICVPLTWGYS